MSENVTPDQDLHPAAQETATVAGRTKKAGKGASSRRSKRQRTAAPVLGVHVTSQTVYAVLMRPTSSGYEPIRQFSRQRSGEAEHAPDIASTILDAVTPDEAITDEDGVTIQFGEGLNTSADLFLETEFQGMAGIGGDVDFEAPSPSTRRLGTPIVFELKDIIEECRTAGYEKPALAFVIGAPDVEYVEVIVPADGGKGEKKGKSGRKIKAKKSSARKSKAEKNSAKKVVDTSQKAVKRERLLSLLPPSDVLYNKDQVAFVPMTPRDNLQRYLAILPRPEEPVVDSLDLLREQQGMRKIVFRDIDSEVTILMGMARMAFRPEPQENTAIVRVGLEDTLVILLQGDQLHHCDHMRSVSTFDGPDTICSRVLLQQDVQGVGTIHNVIICSEEREEELVQGFSAFYPEARVDTLRAGLATMGISGPYGPLPTTSITAAGIALKALIRRDSSFEDISLMPKRLRKRARKFDLSFSWHTIVVGVLLFMSVLFFVGLFLKQSSDISRAERHLAEIPSEASLTQIELQFRIDSLRLAQQQITESLVILDSLLYGTDQWSQTLALTNRAAAGAGSIWVEDWNPGDQDINIHGYATSRAKVVDLASRLTASIEELTFSKIREYPVYEYRMRFALPNELPAAAQFLREQAGEALPPRPILPEPLAGSVPLSSDPSTPPPPTGDAEPAEGEAAASE